MFLLPRPRENSLVIWKRSSVTPGDLEHDRSSCSSLVYMLRHHCLLQPDDVETSKGKVVVSRTHNF